MHEIEVIFLIKNLLGQTHKRFNITSKEQNLFFMKQSQILILQDYDLKIRIQYQYFDFVLGEL